jgi:HlyD family secretion protein
MTTTDTTNRTPQVLPPKIPVRLTGRQIAWIACGVVVALAVTWIIWAVSRRSAPGMADAPMARVVRADLPVTVMESGEIEAARSRVIRNEINWSVIIESVVPEGTIVEKGQPIIVFKCKELEDELKRQEIEATNAENAYLQSVGTRQLKEEETSNNVAKAEQAVTDAKDDLRRYNEGEHPTQEDELKAAIQMAKRDLALAEDKLSFKLKANSDPDLSSPFSANEIEADRLGVERLKASLTKAQSDLRMYVDYDHPRNVRRLETAVRDAEIKLKRTNLEREAQMNAALGDEKTREFTRNAQAQKLKDLREDFSKLTVVADTPGLVVYDTGRNRWDRTQVLIAPSEKISPRQQLMIIPDMGTLQIKTRVYEAVVDQVKGQRSTIAISDAPDGAAFASAGGEGARKDGTRREGSRRRPASAPGEGEAASMPASGPASRPASQAHEPAERTEARIRLDAKSDLVLNGHVRFVAPLPDSQGGWGPSTGVKVFNVIVTFDPDQPLDGLKPGMTAQVELLLANLRGVLQVPVAAVFTEQQQTYVYRVRGGSVEKTPVKVGRMNEKSVEVISGLAEGDIVRLTQPAETTSTRTDDAARQGA